MLRQKVKSLIRRRLREAAAGLGLHFLQMSTVLAYGSERVKLSCVYTSRPSKMVLIKLVGYENKIFFKRRIGQIRISRI